jgi:hypothetical protein
VDIAAGERRQRPDWISTRGLSLEDVSTELAKQACIQWVGETRTQIEDANAR